MEVEEPATYGETWSTEPPVPPPVEELWHMTSGWGPNPYAPQISKDWFGQAAFVPVPGGLAIHSTVPGF